MEKQEFLQKYNAIESTILEKKGWHPLTVPVWSDILYLIRLLIQDSASKIDVLIPKLDRMELSLCCDNWIGYSTEPDLLREIHSIVNGSIHQEDFLQADISEKFDQILLSTIGEKIFNEVTYIEKSLDRLKKDGILVVLATASFLDETRFAPVRQKILDNFSLEAIFPLKDLSKATCFNCAIIVIKNTKQRPKIYMPPKQHDFERNRKNENDVEMWINQAKKAFICYKCGEGDSWVDSQNINNRFDPEYYIPENIQCRKELQEKKTMALLEIADVFSTNRLGFDSETRETIEKKSHGDYVFVTPRHMHNGKISLDDDHNDFCLKEDLSRIPSESKYILKSGDILISTLGFQIKWAIYDGDNDFAIANRLMAIVRAKNGCEKIFKMFFSTPLGKEMLEKQLRMSSTGSNIAHLSLQSILNIRVPDLKSMEFADSLYKYKDFVAKIKVLFKECGWNIEPIYVDEDSRSDLKLLFGGKLRGIVIARYIKSDSIYDNEILVGQLKKYREQYVGVPVYLYIDDGIYEYDDDIFYPLLELPRPELAKARRQTVSESVQKEKKVEPLNHNEASTTDTFLLQQIFAQMKEIKEGVAGLNQKMDILSKKLSEISNQITSYQSVVERQLEYASSDQEKEVIIRGFTEQCIEQIKNKTKEFSGLAFYNHEKEKLIESFGESAWNKMDASSQNFLITSKITFEKYISMADVVDFSGVCLLVTSALENELTKRFCTGFIAFLDDKYQKKYENFPPALLNRYSKTKRPTNAKHFEIGSTLCIFNPSLPDWKLTKEQQECTQQELLDYAKNRLMKECPEEKILPTFKKYAVTINDIRIKYRNKAAHTDALTRTDAKECFDLVIDVTKFLREMLDSFDE